MRKSTSGLGHVALDSRDIDQRDLALEILAEQFAPAFNGSSRADFGSMSGWWSDLRPPIFVRQERPGEFK